VAEAEAQVQRGKVCFADLPGFGFAKVSQGMRNQWQELIEQYLFQRENLGLLLLLIDCRRSPKEEEKWLAELGRGGNLLIVLTKGDKLSRNQLAKQKSLITKELGIDSSSVFPTSLVGKSKGGVDTLRDEILGRLHPGRG
jgi:GTP-binding protein